MSQLIVRGHESQPALELRGLGPNGAPTRMVVCAGQLDVCTDGTEGPARVASTLRFLVPGGPTLSTTCDPAMAHASVIVHPLGVTPISMSDARVLVCGARAAFVADGRGGVALGVEVSLEGLYLSPPASIRLAYQVTATIPEA
ncbi:MAG: hypothetical protein U0326_43280 [Polyangiales bacterium]